LRPGDGIHFTKFGARKLALYVERGIERSLSRVPVALPVPADQGLRTTKGKPGTPVRPEAGPVVPPLTGTAATTGFGSHELLGGSRERPADPVMNRVLNTDRRREVSITSASPDRQIFSERRRDELGLTKVR